MGACANEAIRALIINGRNNHDWRSTTDHLRATLTATARFEVDVSTAPQRHFPRIPRKAPHPEDEAALVEARKHFEKPLAEANADLSARWEKWNPEFASADVVVLNYNGDDWPSSVQEAGSRLDPYPLALCC